MPRHHFKDSNGKEWHVAEGVSVVWDPVLGFDDHPEVALLFDSADEARRLFDYPDEWRTLADDDMLQLLAKATPSWTREQQEDLGEGIIDTLEEAQTVLELDAPELLGPLLSEKADETQPDSARDAEEDEERKPAA